MSDFATDRLPWLQERRTGLGSSDISAVLGMNRWRTRRDVWLDKTGRAPLESEPSWPMLAGTWLEHAIREWFEARTQFRVERVGMQRSASRSWMLYSPDGLVNQDALFEAKYTNWRHRDEWIDEQTADHAELQVQWGMAVTGRVRAYVVVAIGDDEPTIRTVNRDEALIAFMIHEAETFWRENILADVEPDVVAADAAAIRSEHPISEPIPVLGGPEVDQWIAMRAKASEQIKSATTIRDEADAHLMKAMGSADTLVIAGEIAATWKTQTAARFDRKAAEAAGVDLTPYLTDSTSRVLRVPDPSKRKAFSRG